jgi:phosphate transport system permease protein
VVLVLILWIGLGLWTQSAVSRGMYGWKMLTLSQWDVPRQVYGALPFIYGTVVTTFLALLLAVPVGVGAAVFLTEMAPRPVAGAVAFFIELLAAVPSVIYGLIGIFAVVPLLRTYVEPGLRASLGFLPLFQGPAYGVGFLAAGLVLSIMVLPFIISISREALLVVPVEQREGALVVDDGAKDALRKHGKSLLAPGITRCEGDFASGDVVRICDADGTEFARGICDFESAKIQAHEVSDVVVHRDNLVIL